MKLIVDTGPVISLLLIRKFDLLPTLFPDFYLPKAVFEELTKHQEIFVFKNELTYLEKKTINVSYYAPISGIDIGETEAIILYKELNAEFLLIDDKKAREKAELLSISCIGTLGLLYLAFKRNKLVSLRPIFIALQNNNRFYSKKYLNLFLAKTGEKKI